MAARLPSPPVARAILTSRNGNIGEQVGGTAGLRLLGFTRREFGTCIGHYVCVLWCGQMRCCCLYGLQTGVIAIRVRAAAHWLPHATGQIQYGTYCEQVPVYWPSLVVSHSLVRLKSWRRTDTKLV